MSLNAYAYCVGDPVNLSDPSGADPPNKGVNKPGSQEQKEWLDHLQKQWRSANKSTRGSNGTVAWARDTAALAAQVKGIAPGATGALVGVGGALTSWSVVITKAFEVDNSLRDNDARAERLLRRAIYQGDDPVAWGLCRNAIASGHSNPPGTPEHLRVGYLESRIYTHDEVLTWVTEPVPIRQYTIGRLDYFDRQDR